MRGLGLAGAGIGAVAAAAPVFHDLGELATSPKANYKRPWYVKGVDEPTVEINWSILEPWDWGYAPSNTVIYNPYFNGYGGTEYGREASSAFKAEASQRQTDIRDAGLAANTPGYALRDKALATGAGFLSFGSGLAPIPFGGQEVTTPEDLGVTKWSGTPEEANNMVRAAAHFYGAANIGVLKFDANIKKLYYPKSTRWEDVDVGYQDGRVSVIPDKCQYIICYVVRQSCEITKRGIAAQNVGGTYGYAHGPIIQNRLTRFIKALGYQAWTGGMNVPLGIMCGLSELGRLNHHVTPEWGSMIRYTPALATDLPLAPTKPIDAGIHKFCDVCKICGTTCQELNGDTPISLDDEPTYEISGPWNRVGVKKYQHNWPKCNFCPYCDGSCPFNVHGIASIHEVIKMVSATTPIFNGFFANMDEFFGYGLRDEEDFAAWWDRDLNTWPYDTTLI